MQSVLLVLIIATVLLLVVSLVRLSASRRGEKAPDIGPPTARPDLLGPSKTQVETPRPPADVREPVAPTPPLGDVEKTTEVEASIEPEVIDEVVAEAEAVVAGAEREAQVEEPVVKPRLRDRLGRARAAMSGLVGGIRSRAIDGDTWEELEEALIRSDLGVQTTMAVLDDLRAAAKADKIKTADDLLAHLKADLKGRLDGDRTLKKADSGPSVWLLVGVNGVGKTTTIGKLARREVTDGNKVMLAAGDTFRAAAGDQLAMWAERTGSDIIRGAEGADPGSVVFDAIEAGAARGAHLVLADTAGRLHNKVNLMEELKKVHRIAERGPGTLTETLLVIDATTGNNGLTQAREFAEAAGVTGVVLTKLDGTAKGGIALAIQAELGIPIKLVGVGEGPDDLIDFDPDEFVDALFEE
ncbi:MAG TPA: signal recognition particle-docking protein FtsY [Acidimicrobiales bacterium]|nr:signal recognition particle-docking protein FtsY [Acidimicrobiales bacterium]